MQTPFPADEVGRLEALRGYEILDTAPEPEFDDLTHLAAHICGTPISAITLVDEERQWFKARVGLPLSQTSRDVSFCAHAILERDILLVPDTSVDERFADNPLVTAEPHLRFYAGVPLVTPEGQAVGTLCVVDVVPRQLDATQLEALRRLGRQAVALLEARPDAPAQLWQSRQTRLEAQRQERALTLETARRDADNLRISEERYRRLFETAQDGILIVDAASGQIENVNPFLCDLLGFAAKEFVGKPFWEVGTFRDIAANRAAFLHLQEQQHLRFDDLPLERKDGGVVPVEFVSKVYFCELKKVVQCNIRDISERKQATAIVQQSQRFLQSTLDALSSHIAVLDETGQIIAVNKAWQQFSKENDGTAASCGVGANYIDVCDRAIGAWSEEAPALAAGIRGVIEGTQQAFCLEYPCHSLREERWFNVCVTRFAGEGPLHVVVAHEDISKRRRDEAALRISEQRYRSLALASTQIVWDTPADGMVEDLPAWRQYTGQSAAQVRGWGWLDALHPDDLAPTREIWLRCIETKNPYETSYRIRAADGSYRLFAVHGVPVLESDGRLREWVGTCADIHDRTLAEDERDRFFTLSLDMLAIIGSDGYMKRLNPAFEDTLGFSNEELKAVPFLEFVHPDDRTATLEGAALLERHIEVKRFENRYRCLDGSYKWLQWTCAPFEDQWYCVARDITKVKQAAAALHKANDELELHVVERTAELSLTNEDLRTEIIERQRAEAEVQRSRQELQTFIDAMSTLAAKVAPDGTFLIVNKIAFDASGLSPEAYMKTNFLEGSWWAHDSQVQSRVREMFGKAVNGTPTNYDEHIFAFGEVRTINFSLTPLRETGGEVDSVIAEGRDITALKITEEALQHAKVEAERANLAKSEFLSRMSHELRTPLNAILGFGQILSRQDLTPLQRESVDYILKGGRHLLDLINEVLDIARVEAGRIELSLEAIALDDIVPEVCAMMRPLAQERSIRLDENCARCGPVLADRQRLKQALINLVANAIKYNREGGQVEVACEHQRDRHISIAVRDTGPGISREDLEKLFTPFERLSAATSQVEGTGLGLVLSRRLVMAMGGTLTVQSTPGQGTTFFIELPEANLLCETSAPLTQSVHLESQGPIERVYRVLCIEDNPSNLRLMETIFAARPDVSLLAANQGITGLDMARQQEPDLILLDLNLPDIGGAEVLARLQQSALTRQIPVVVVSADATPHQKERLLLAGASDFLLKPLDVEQFLQCIRKFLKEAPTIVTLAKSSQPTL